MLWWKMLPKFMVEELGFEVSENGQCLYVHPKTYIAKAILGISLI